MKATRTRPPSDFYFTGRVIGTVVRLNHEEHCNLHGLISEAVCVGERTSQPGDSVNAPCETICCMMVSGHRLKTRPGMQWAVNVGEALRDLTGSRYGKPFCGGYFMDKRLGI